MTAAGRGWLRLLAPAALALVASSPARAVRAQDKPAPVAEAPFTIEVSPTAQVIVVDPAERGVSGDPTEHLSACAAVPGCRAVWDDAIGTIVILDYVPSAPAAEPESPESGAAASDAGSAPR
jgi:hypothetical protein